MHVAVFMISFVYFIDEGRVLATQARGNDIVNVDNNFRDTIADEMWFNRDLEHG